MPVFPERLVMRSDRVLLRDWEPADAPAIKPVCGDWNVCQFSSVPWQYTPQGAQAWIERLRARRTAGSALALAITHIDEPLPVGNVNLVRFSDERHEAALGYWLSPTARRQGLASEAARVLCDWGFRELGLERIELAILPGNAVSHAVAARLGATREGLRHDSHAAGSRRWDMVIYSLLGPSTR